MRALPLALCCCLVLAGCSAPTGPAPLGEPTPTEPTVTPAPVPETAPAVLPGVGVDDENETQRFRAVNREALENGSLRGQTVYQLETVRDGDILARATTVRRVENATTMLLTFEQHYPDMSRQALTDVEVWVGPDAAYERLEHHGRERVTQRHPNPADIRRTVDPDADLLVEALHSTPLEPTDRYAVDGETWYVLTGERDSVPSIVDRFATTSNRDVRLTARVDAAGVVRSLSVTWRGEYRNQTVRGQYVVRFGQFGEATAPRPVWVDRLLEPTPTHDTTAPGTDETVAATPTPSPTS